MSSPKSVLASAPVPEFARARGRTPRAGSRALTRAGAHGSDDEHRIVWSSAVLLGAVRLARARCEDAHESLRRTLVEHGIYAPLDLNDACGRFVDAEAALAREVDKVELDSSGDDDRMVWKRVGNGPGNDPENGPENGPRNRPGRLDRR